VRLAPNQTPLFGLTRTATTDEHARSWFRRHSTSDAGSGAPILLGSLSNAARRAAEPDQYR
jgi:hypothetical protein